MLCVKGKDMVNSFCVKSVKKRIVKYGWISERCDVGDFIDFVYFIVKLVFLIFIVDNIDCRFKI